MGLQGTGSKDVVAHVSVRASASHDRYADFVSRRQSPCCQSRDESLSTLSRGDAVGVGGDCGARISRNSCCINLSSAPGNGALFSTRARSQHGPTQVRLAEAAVRMDRGREVGRRVLIWSPPFSSQLRLALHCVGPFLLRQFRKTVRAERPASVTARGHDHDCGDRRQLRVTASAAYEVVAFAARFESELRDRRGIVDQLDPNKVMKCFQKDPP